MLTDLAYRFIPTPGPLAMLKGPLAPVTRVGVAWLVSSLVSTFAGKRNGVDMLNGALTVIGYGFINDQVLTRLPVIGVGEYISGDLGYQDAAVSFDPAGTALPDAGADDFTSAGIGEYISGLSM